MKKVTLLALFGLTLGTAFTGTQAFATPSITHTQQDSSSPAGGVDHIGGNGGNVYGGNGGGNIAGGQQGPALTNAGGKGTLGNGGNGSGNGAGSWGGSVGNAGNGGNGGSSEGNHRFF